MDRWIDGRREREERWRKEGERWGEIGGDWSRSQKKLGDMEDGWRKGEMEGEAIWGM